jgi:para-nitrobenzyl esterase
LAEAMADYWTNFAKSGNPNGATLPTWLPYDSRHERALELGDEIKMIDYPNLVPIRILDEIFANYL